MLRRLLRLTFIAGLCCSANAPAQDSVPVRKVVLYKNGVGYFEHVGKIQGEQSVEITLPSSQLNDVLKSLTVLDLGHGQVTGVSYDSTAPLERRFAELPINPGTTPGLVNFLNQLRGSAVEIRTPGGVVAGKLLSAELKSRSAGQGGTAQSVEISLFQPSGEVRVVDLESAGALKFTEPALAADLGRYMDLLDSSHQRDVRHLKIQTAGSGERQLYISYTAETPVWKTTYRVVLDPKQKPLLQGWAIVDNTTSMDWMNVTLSLIAGAPVSFVQNLSQPLYARRPVVPVQEGLQVSPQVHEATLDEPKAAPPPAPARAAAQAPSPMFKSRLEPGATAEMAGQIADRMREQDLELPEGRAIGEQFEYRLKQPVSIRRNESALLLVLQSDVGGEKVAIFNADSGESHPRLAFWLKNTSGLTLDGGSFSVIDENAFAGEGLLQTVQPGENRLLSYAVDLGTEVSTRSGSERQRVERVQINRGVLRMEAKVLDKKTYSIRNNNDKPRLIVLEHPVRNGWQLVQTAAPAESTASNYRFRIEAKPKTTTEFVVREESPQETTFNISSLTPDQIAFWVRERSIDPEIEKGLRNIAAKKNEINDLAQKITALDKEQNDIFRDQERVRGNLQRLGQNPEEAALRQRYIREMEQQENRLAAIRSDRDKLEGGRAAAQRQLDDLIQSLSLDRKL